MNRVVPLVLAGALWSCGAEAQSPAVTAFIDVQVVPMDRERVLEHQTVVVRGKAISEMGAVRHEKVQRAAVMSGLAQFFLQ